MGLQHWSCPANALFTLGMFQIVGFLDQRKLLVEDVFGDFFIDPDTEEGWAKIQQIIEPHGMSKIMLTGATPSKPIRQGDGQFGPFMIQKQHANFCMMYNKAEELGNIKNPDDEDLRMWWNFADFPFQNQEASMRWNAIVAAYEVIHEIEANVELMVEAIKPLYYSNQVFSKTPMEVQFFAGEMMNGNVMVPDGLCNIPWGTVDQFKTDNPLDPGIIDIMFGFPLSALWYIPVPVITFGSGAGSQAGDPSTTYALSSDDDCFCKTGSFVPDPPDPDPPPPAPPYTPVTGTVTPDLFTSNLWKAEIVAGTNPVITGTINYAYRRLIVTFP